LRKLAGRSGFVVRIADVDVLLDAEFVSQNWESLEHENYARFSASIRESAVVFDVGAHIGTYTIIACKKGGPNCRVLAFEPTELTRSFLARHLSWNDCATQATVRAICCGREMGEVKFYQKRGSVEGMNGVVPVAGFEEISLPMTSLDEESRKFALVPDVIKIDVEGGELEVLKGASNILERARPLVFVSLHPKALALQSLSSADVVGFVEQFGYTHEVLGQDHEIHVLFSPNLNAHSAIG
jgi:FkbM family methyltransferase